MGKAVLLIIALSVFALEGRAAEIWPDSDWASTSPPAGPALQALEAYAFAPRSSHARMPCWSSRTGASCMSATWRRRRRRHAI